VDAPGNDGNTSSDLIHRGRWWRCFKGARCLHLHLSKTAYSLVNMV
jgi:hypothetical protein